MPTKWPDRTRTTRRAIHGAAAICLLSYAWATVWALIPWVSGNNVLRDGLRTVLSDSTAHAVGNAFALLFIPALAVLALDAAHTANERGPRAHENAEEAPGD